MRNIMFVCTGNICRSAMAEYLLRKKLKEHNLENKVSVFSAGTYAYDGDVPTYDALEVMKNEYDIDMSQHKATPIQKSNIENMDLVLCMASSHKRSLNLRYADMTDRIFLLKEYVGAGSEIDDPYGYGIDVYKNCAKEIDTCLDLLLKKEFGVSI